MKTEFLIKFQTFSTDHREVILVEGTNGKVFCIPLMAIMAISSQEGHHKEERRSLITSAFSKDADDVEQPRDSYVEFLLTTGIVISVTFLQKADYLSFTNALRNSYPNYTHLKDMI